MSYGEYCSEHDLYVSMHTEDAVNALYGVDLDGDVDMDNDSEAEEEDEEEEDEEEEDEEKDEDEEEDEDKKEDEDDEEDEDEDDGKQPQTVGQEEMVNMSADDVDTMVDNQPIVLSEQGHKMHEHDAWPQPLAPAPQPQPPECGQQPRTAESNPLSGPQILGFVTPQNLHPAVPTARGAEPAGNTSDVRVDQQLLGGPAGDDSLPDVPVRNVLLPEAPPDGSVGEE